MPCPFTQIICNKHCGIKVFPYFCFTLCDMHCDRQNHSPYMTKGKIDALLGIVFGDEGKGKVVDFFTPHYDVVARFAGGPNAGHTIIFDGKKFVLRSIPSGIFDESKVNIIGNGCVVAPDLFMAEAHELEAAGYSLTDRLHISRRAHLILPTHRYLDRAYEAAKGKGKVGTTGKGIGPTYSDKAARVGLRVGDIENDFIAKYEALKARHLQILSDMHFTDFNLDADEGKWLEGVEYMKRFQLSNTETEINQLLAEGKNVLAEGAQGSLLDIDHGTYPFVSSSSTTSGGVCTGLGVAPSTIDRVFGIFKAYSTRVGSGPFPVELFDETGDTIRHIGNEYGAVTGRNRRCGWLDLVALKYAITINGVTDLVMMKSDVLDSFKKIYVCKAYEKNGVVTTEMPYDTEGWKAVYEELPGWDAPLTGLRSEDELPQIFKDYVAYIEKATDTPIKILSVGPDREATIMR